MSRLLVAALCLGLLPPVAHAAPEGGLDPESLTPYHLRVVLHFADHPSFTPVFRAQVRGQLHDNIQAALGDLGDVEVVDDLGSLSGPERAALRGAEGRGLEQAFEDRSWKNISNTKTHLVFIDLVNHWYEIRARQHDGSTGLASPVVRHERTRDRLFIARAATRLVGRDFGLVGTVVGRDADQAVRVGIKGGKLGAPLTGWLQPGDVLAVAQLNRGTGGERSAWSFQVPAALLQVTEEPKDGVCRCQLFHRYEDAPSNLERGPGVLGFRCLKLGTAVSRVRLRFVDKDRPAQAIVRPITVVVRPEARFDRSVKEEKLPVRDGFVETEKPFSHVAFVQVSSEGVPVSGQIPVEVFEGRTVTCPLTISPDAEQRGQFDLQRKRWEGQLYERLLVLSDLRKEINKLLKAKENKAAQEKAEAGLGAVKEDVTRLEEELDRLAPIAKQLKMEQALKDGRDRLADLKAGQAELERSVKDLGQILKEEPKWAEVKSLIEQAKQREQEAEFDQAIKNYQEAVELGRELANFKAQLEPWVKHLDQLKKDWEAKGPEHEQARDFIYQVWPKLDSVAKLNERIDEAGKAFKVCKEAGDRLTPVMLLKANVAHVSRLKSELEALKEQANEDNKQKAETIDEFIKKLIKLTDEATDFVRGKKPAGKPS